MGCFSVYFSGQFSILHRIDWESSEILATESDYKKRRFLESFYIHKTDFSFNDKINSFYPGLYKFINI